MISTEQQLEDLLSQPTPQDTGAIQKLDSPLLILGVGGKMGPSLARRARRAAEQAGVDLEILGVSRFSEAGLQKQLEQDGIRTIAADLLNEKDLSALPESPNVIYMAARKFGTGSDASLTWAMNVYLPGRVADRYKDSKIVAFSSGNVYPIGPIAEGGSEESDVLAPVGEYGQTALGRERIFEYSSRRHGTPMTILRLNYAVETRYGVLLDIGRKVFEGQPIDLSMGQVNVIWQGDANSVCLRALDKTNSPPFILNLTGPETLSVRWIAEQFGRHLDRDPIFHGQESASALLNNASQCHELFGYPSVTPRQVIEWTAGWISSGGRQLGKPTHFEVRDGKF